MGVGVAADRGRQDGLPHLTQPPDGAVHPREWLIAAAVSLACLLFGLATLKPQTLWAYDQPLYLGIASDLQQTGTYTNGRWGAAGQPGAYTAPLYPGFVAALASVSPALAQAAACVRTAEWAAIAACPVTLGPVVPLQVGLMAGTLMLVWRSTLAVGGGRWAAWCALLAAGLGTTEYAVYARTAMTEALSLPLAAAAGLLLVLLVRQPRWPTALGLGAALGLLTLARPEYLYLIGAMAGTGLALLLLWRRLAVAMLAACLVACLVLAPWSVRNERLFGTVAPTWGYAGFILAQRMAYEAMTPAEWTAQWLYALPGFGPAAARMLFPNAVARLGWQDRPDTFYMVGNTTALQQLRTAAPNPADQVPYLLRRYVWPHPLRFAAVTAVMAWKSLWVRKYFSLVAFPFLVALALRALRQRDPALIAFLIPPLFIVALHAATSVATPRYSLILVPCYAAAFGLYAGPALQYGLRRLDARWRSFPA